jgi:DNA-binding NtrC family response regulator
MRILAIDDDPIFLKLIEATVKKNLLPGDELFLASSGDEGIRIVFGDQIDLVITDIQMPGMSGIEAAKRIKNFRPETEIMVVTGAGSIESAVEAMKAGARDYITKPFNADMLVEKLGNIRELLERSGEAEEYRMEKEIIEESASNSVMALEKEAAALIKVMDDIRSEITSSHSDQEKVKAVSIILNTYSSER